MNGKLAKMFRRIARKETEVHGAEMVEVKGTTRVRTASNGAKVKTATMSHPKGSYRNTLKAVKGRNSGLFNPDENNHAVA